MSQHFVYIMLCQDNSLYTGYTVNISERLKAHNEGKASKYTRGRLPVQCVYLELCSSKSEALKREIEIKKLSKANKQNLITSYQSTCKLAYKTSQLGNNILNDD